MGIDIYIGGYAGYNSRTINERAAFQKACKHRDALPQTAKQRIAKAQQKVNDAADEMWSGKHGYLCSSYNSGGLFNVLDRIFGIDTGAILFPGNWDEQERQSSEPDQDGEYEHGMTIDWEAFNATVAVMKELASTLKHGTRLPVTIHELAGIESPARQRAEAFGNRVMGMLAAIAEDAGGTLVSGNDHQHGFYNDDDYGWYVTTGLANLEAFGKCGAALAAAGQPNFVYISF